MAGFGSDSSLVGRVLDERYEVLEEIGSGGVGIVYRARRVKLDRLVALKVLQASLADDPAFVGRFQREAVALSRLYHPHCVAVADFGVYGTRPYLVLEYVPGETIKQLVEQGPFMPVRAVHVALQLLETLEYFHGHHVIHRDLKSENVMLVESSGTKDFVKVLDFGMAKILMGPGADSQLSKIGIVPGTPSAMAPEQIYQLPPDPRIDIYATGILLYEMIVGKRPFTGKDMATVIKMQVSTPPKRPREVLGEEALSPELEQVIIKALEKDRVDRFGTAAEMAAALRLTPEGSALPPLAEGRVSSAGPPRGEGSAPQEAPRRRKWPLRGGMSAAIALGAFAAVQPWPPRWLPHFASAPFTAPAPAPPAATPASIPTPLPSPPPTPPPQAPAPAPVVEPWLAHRDLAVTYAGRGRHDDAFREIEAAIRDNAALAAADPALVDAAAGALTIERIAFLVEHFRENPRLVEALATASASGATVELRKAAYDALDALGQAGRADRVAMRMLDLEQAASCSEMRAVFKQLRATKDPRVRKIASDLRARGRKDPDVRCLRRLLRR